MKSGIKSIGESAYPIVIPASIFAGSGVTFFFMHKNIAGISVFGCLALSTKLIVVFSRIVHSGRLAYVLLSLLYAGQEERLVP